MLTILSRTQCVNPTLRDDQVKITSRTFFYRIIFTEIVLHIILRGSIDDQSTPAMVLILHRLSYKQLSEPMVI